MTVANRQPHADTYPIRAHFGVRLRRWRLIRGLSQADLGALLGYDRTLISRVECGLRWPAKPLALGAERALRTGNELAGLWPLVERERRSAEVVARRTGDDPGDDSRDAAPRRYRAGLVRVCAGRSTRMPRHFAGGYVELRVVGARPGDAAPQ